jgi:hypothetical protein
MSLLLDTNVVSEMRRRQAADANLHAWSHTVLVDSLFVSAVTLWELEQGILLVARRDGRQGDILRRWMLMDFLPRFRDRILPFDGVVALRCAPMHVPDPKPDRDSMIAATAAVHALTVATRNTKYFAACGVPTFNPWLYEP